jgi:methionine aminotransferase
VIQFNTKLPGVAQSIFAVMTQLANQYGAINLSQGFPDFEVAPELIALVNDAYQKGFNQYAPMPGIIPLREQIAAKANRLHQANYHPESEVTVTAGATQAIFTAISAFVQPNDEVIIFEPAYDCYAPSVKLQGGIVKYMALQPPNYAIDWTQVQKLTNANTRMIILNAPHNPTGMVLTDDDIQQLIRITRNTNILILSDEVYEHIIFDGRQHLSMARHPELRERSLIVASFGKLFHTTGWKLGYCMAPERLMNEFRKVHQFMVFSVHTPLQYAIAEYMDQNRNFNELGTFFEQKRDYFRSMLAESRFELLDCQGSYFQSVQYSGISDEADTEFASRLIKEFGVASIPTSAFYSRNTDHKVLRLCFAKKDETLEQAAEKLRKV